MSPEPRRLLIISCSQRKRIEPGLLPAIERYDGPAFRVLRRFLKEQPSEPLDIYILSAKFGLIPGNQLTPNYDQTLTLLRAQELHPNIITKLRQILYQPYQKLCICMGQGYLRALDGYNALVPSDVSLKIATGSPGKKLAELHTWLHEQPLVQRSIPISTTAQGKAHIRGIEVIMAPTQIFDVAHHALLIKRDNAFNYYSWYVLIDGQKVSTKWLVGQLFGIPVSAFSTGEARRALEQLGIEVRHT